MTDRSFWVDRPVFVTGATGLVGGWLVEGLVALGADVTCLVRDWTPQSPLIADGAVHRVQTVRGELRDRALLERVLVENEITTVFHLAAQTLVPVANANPVSTFESNVAGTWNLLEAVRRSPRVGQVVVASSDKAYGEHRDLPYTEQHALQGLHPYDVSKSCADLIAQSYASAFGVPVSITRCGNFFGGGDLNFNRLIPGTIRSVLRGQAPTLRSDGQSVRDYFYVEDGVRAYLDLAEAMADNPSLAGEAFNFSYELPMTTIEVVENVLQCMQSSLVPEVLGHATHEIDQQWLSAAKARTLIDWTPRFSWAEGLRRTVDWYRKKFGVAANEMTPALSYVEAR